MALLRGEGGKEGSNGTPIQILSQLLPVTALASPRRLGGSPCSSGICCKHEVAEGLQHPLRRGRMHQLQHFPGAACREGRATRPQGKGGRDQGRACEAAWLRGWSRDTKTQWNVKEQGRQWRISRCMLLPAQPTDIMTSAGPAQPAECTVFMWPAQPTGIMTSAGRRRACGSYRSIHIKTMYSATLLAGSSGRWWVPVAM